MGLLTFKVPVVATKTSGTATRDGLYENLFHASCDMY